MFLFIFDLPMILVYECTKQVVVHADLTNFIHSSSGLLLCLHTKNQFFDTNGTICVSCSITLLFVTFSEWQDQKREVYIWGGTKNGHLH